MFKLIYFFINENKMKEIISFFMYFLMNDDWNIHISNENISFTKNKQHISTQDNFIIHSIKSYM